MFRPGLIEAALIAALSCAVPSPAPAQQPGSAQQPGPAQPAAPAPASDADWSTPGKDFANTRFSPLADIDADNVKNLTLAFSFDLGTNRGEAAAPVVSGGTMFVLTPYPNRLYALDLARPDDPVRWTYTPDQEPAVQGLACCDVIARGPTVAGSRIYFNTLDGRTVALDSASGQHLWETKVADPGRGETMTMAPLAVKDAVIVGNSGSDYGARGFVAALDAASGAIRWKAYSTGPDSDTGIGGDFKPFYAQDRGKDLGVATWPADAWQQGGGAVSGFISYDPALDLIFHGTGHPAPRNADQRAGDNKWTSGIFARAADTGAARWFYQWSPHDPFGYGGDNENVLVDASWHGAPRQLLVHADGNGYVYVLDRASGEVLSAEPFVHVNVSRGVDLQSGKPRWVDRKTSPTGYTVHDACPATAGGKGDNPSAYSPSLGLLYIPASNLCMDFEPVPASYIAGTPWIAAEVRMRPGPGGHRGALVAWNVAEARPAWSIKENFPLAGGMLATAGDLVFYGTLDGSFKAVRARSGEPLWQFKTESGIVGQPVTYRGPDGRQYVAMLSGIGGAAGALVSAELDVRDATAANGFAAALRDLPRSTRRGGRLYVFALP